MMPQSVNSGPGDETKLDTNERVRDGSRIASNLGELSRSLGRCLDSRTALAGLLTCLGYYAGAKLGFALTLQPQPISVLWPPNSILLAAMLLTPIRVWWFILLAAAPAHWAAQLQSDVPQSMILCWFISNSCEALLGAAGMRYLAGDPLRFDSFRNVCIFILCGVFLGPFLSSFLDSAFVTLNRWGGSSYWEVWRTRFFANALAAMALVTVIVSWSRVDIRSMRKASHWLWGEAALMISALLVVGFVVFVRQQPGPETQPVLLYAPLPFLVWAAVRFGFTGASTSILMVALLAIWATAHGKGPFASSSPLQNALSVQIFLILISIPLLCLAAVLQERRKAEEALRCSEQRYREVIETQTDLICRFLPDTTLTFVNEAYCRLFKRPREALIGVKFVELLSETEAEKALKYTTWLLKNPPAKVTELEMLLPDGTHAWHEWTHHAIFAPDGSVIEFQAIGRDITDRKRVQEANERLAHVSRLAMVGELTASIAHEINQPLGAILSNADAAGMLLEATPEKIEEVKQILADIRKDDLRASEVIRHIRALLRKRQLETELLDMNDLASNVVRLTRAEARKRNMAWETEFASALPPVKGDRVHLQQVLLNLMLNAMDAMTDVPENERRLAIGTALHESGGVEVIVRDTGRGIAQDRFPKLFQSFYTTKKEGMGLGLSISRMIIETHHGQIRAENNIDKGATFRVILPAHKAALTT